MFLIWFDGVETNVNHVNLHNQCQGLIEADKDHFKIISKSVFFPVSDSSTFIFF